MNEAPLLRVVRGDPSPDELAALVAVLASRAAPENPPPPRARLAWADPTTRLRRPLRPGPQAWRRSGLPA